MEEKSILEDVIEKRGHILLLTPKCHPEIAGLGIEYCWGKSKLDFRRSINDFTGKNLITNVLKSLSSEHLPLNRVRKYARKTREYLKVYKEIDQIKKSSGTEMSDMEALKELDSSVECYENIEKMLKEYKVHRNILDIDLSGI